MNINEMYPSKWLRAADLKGREIKVKIERVDMESMSEDSSEEKPVVYFTGKEKGLVLNKTNGTSISSAFGPDTDGWTGKEIILFSTKVPFQGQVVDAIRVRPAAKVLDEDDSESVF